MSHPPIKRLQQPRGCLEVLEQRQTWFGWTEQSPLNLGFLFCSKLSVLGKKPVLEVEVLQALIMLGMLSFLCCLCTSPKICVLYHLIFYPATTHSHYHYPLPKQLPLTTTYPNPNPSTMDDPDQKDVGAAILGPCQDGLGVPQCS